MALIEQRFSKAITKIVAQNSNLIYYLNNFYFYCGGFYFRLNRVHTIK